MPTYGSWPTIHASCPGGIDATSPGPISISFPSSILMAICPEMVYTRWETSQLSVPTIGLTHSDHFQPGWKVAHMTWTPPKFRTSTLPLSTLRVSSAELKFFFVVSAILVPPDERYSASYSNWMYGRCRVCH